MTDLDPYRLSDTGIDFVHCFDSGVAGPHVMINGLTHGDEPCGRAAVLRMLADGIRPTRGRLTLSLANIAARGRRFVDRDLNRLWRDDLINADTKCRETRRARELRPWLRMVDVLLDLHSTWSVGRPFLVLADLGKTRKLADRLGWPPTQFILPGGCAEGRHMIDYGRFSDPDDPAIGITVECGRHDDPAAAEVAYGAAMRLLAVLGMHDPSDAPHDHGTPERYVLAGSCVVQTDSFAWRVPLDGFTEVHRGDVVAMDGGTPVTAPLDGVLVAPRPHPKPGEIAFHWAR